MMSERFRVKVTDVFPSGEGIKVFRLESEGTEKLPGFTPGAHIDVEIREGLVRQYSLCGSCDGPDSYLIAVKEAEDSRGGSTLLHAGVTAGGTLRIGSPRNHFALSESDRRSILIAGGIGVTPMVSMARHLRARKADFELHYFARSEAHVAFLDTLTSIGGTVFHLGLDADEVSGRLREILGQERDGAGVYVCGPPPLIDLVTTLAASLGWPPDAIKYERFSATGATAQDAGGEFVVELARSGKTCVVPADKTIVQALESVGTYIDTSCEEGVCGTCIVDVLAGVPDHRDEVLSPADKASNHKIVTCVSRCKSGKLVLDI